MRRPDDFFRRANAFRTALRLAAGLVILLCASYGLAGALMGGKLFRITGDSVTAGGGASKAASFSETCGAVGSEVETGVSSSAHFQDHSGSVFPVPAGTSARRDWNEYR